MEENKLFMASIYSEARRDRSRLGNNNDDDDDDYDYYADDDDEDEMDEEERRLEEKKEAYESFEAMSWSLSRKAKRKKLKKVRKKYKRRNNRPKSRTQQEVDDLKESWNEEYEHVKKAAPAGKAPSLWSFESLFPEPVWDEVSIQKDLYGDVKERDQKLNKQKLPSNTLKQKLKTSTTSAGTGSSSVMRMWRDEEQHEQQNRKTNENNAPKTKRKEGVLEKIANSIMTNYSVLSDPSLQEQQAKLWNASNATVNPVMTRMVEDRLYGFRRSPSGNYEYDTSLLKSGSVEFRDGVRIGRPLKINADIITYHARKALRKGRLGEAQKRYERAIEIDPEDGRAYLGLSRVAQRRRDYKLARQCLRTGIANSVSFLEDGRPDNGANPFLLQALGVLEEKMGHLSEAEALYISAVKSRPSHAAAWVSLAQLRTRKLRQCAAAGRMCYESAEREMKKANAKPSAHLYTAWANLEYKGAGDVRRARRLYLRALEIDPRCSVAYLQLGVMESKKEHWDVALLCFDKALRFDPHNSRILQAFAIVETKRPGGTSRKAIDLFERAIKKNPHDGGAVQAYALYVLELGDIDVARDLLKTGTELNKRHAPLWQAWGVLETREGNADVARDIFQQGIWACAQVGGGQSGGDGCARLWQAWGVLEAKEQDHAAARRCFSRALDADHLNVPAVTAWAGMEERLGNDRDARSIYERSLKQFPTGSDEKMKLWRAYELMEERMGGIQMSQQVYQRSIRDSLLVPEVEEVVEDVVLPEPPPAPEQPEKKEEYNVLRWGGSFGGRVWNYDGWIEGKVPKSAMNKKKQAQNDEDEPAAETPPEE